MQGKYPVITLCGSTRFKDQFMEAQNLAVNRLFKKDDTDQSADFISIVAFKNQADFLEKFGKKGVKLLITGRIQTGSYDKGGTRIYTTDVIAE
ncbi:MAG: single-stranded DNA-binding protein [Butyrivibrio sp.]|nr:single-stranded DNA-binding protein [Butyrivibrio sp.]